MKAIKLSHKFVNTIPEKLKEKTIYIAIDLATAIHKCCCGCGKEVVTPLTPTDWELVYDGVSISLKPSIGNWSFDCKSHYWIVHNKVRWDTQCTRVEISASRLLDQRTKAHYDKQKEIATSITTGDEKPITQNGWLSGLIRWFKKLIRAL